MNRRGMRFLAIGTCSFALAGLVAAQGHRVNGPLSRLSGGRVHESHISADGAWAVYAADQETVGVIELYAAPLKGGTDALRIGGPLGPGPTYWAISPDSLHVVFESPDLYSDTIDRSSLPKRLADPLVIGKPYDFVLDPAGERVVFRASFPGSYKGLYSAPVDGSAPPVTLIAPTPQGGALDGFEVSADGARVVFVSLHVNGTVPEIYSVPIAGGPLRFLAAPLTGNGTNQFSLRLSPDSQRVVYRVAQTVVSGKEIFSVPIDGSAAAVRLNGPLVSGGNVEEFAISSDSERVVYVADEDAVDVFELFSAPIDGSAPALRLNPPLPSGADVGFQFRIHPAGDFVVYVADQVQNNRFQLFVVAIDGSTPALRINAPLPAQGDVTWFDVTPDGSRVLYLADLAPFPDRAVDLWSVELAHGLARTKLLEGTALSGFQISPTGSHVLFRPGLVSVSIDDSTTVQIEEEQLGVVEISSDGSRVLYLAQRPGDTAELVSSPIDEHAPIVLNTPPVQGELVSDVASFQVSADGESLVFHSNGLDRDEDESVTDGLFRAAADGSGAPLRLYPASGLRSDDIVSYRIAPDGQRVIFLSGDELGEFDDFVLSSATLDGAPAVRLSPHFSTHFAIAPAGDLVAFAEVITGENDGTLLAVPIDGSAPAYELSGPLLGGGSLRFVIAPDSSRVVYLGAQLSSQSELFSVLLDGSGSPVRLSANLPAQGRIRSFAVDSSSQRGVYLADQDAATRDELWSAPIDGSAAPTKLNAALVAGGDVTEYALAADGTRVFYLADQDADEVFELYSVATAGGVPVKLSGTLVAGGDVWSFHPSADGADVAFVADGAINNVRELFAAPALGGSAPVKLSGVLNAGGNVLTSVQLTSDGSTAVYVADVIVDERFELYAAPLDGSGPRKLSGPLQASGDVHEVFRLSPDGRTVAYAADARADEVVELFAARLDGARPLERLNSSLVAGGDVALASFAFHPDSERVYYVADQLIDGVRELFLSFAGVPHRRAPSAPTALGD